MRQNKRLCQALFDLSEYHAVVITQNKLLVLTGSGQQESGIELKRALKRDEWKRARSSNHCCKISDAALRSIRPLLREGKSSQLAAVVQLEGQSLIHILNGSCNALASL